MNIGAFDGLDRDAAGQVLEGVCSAPRWAAAVADGRPYGSLDALQDAAASALTDADLDPALAGHPRIGDRPAGGASAREQAAVASAPDGVRAELAAGNAAYEGRFGRVYLVCASGRSAEDLLATLHARLGNDPETERKVALRELAAINRLRLAALFAEGGPA
jgi:2-oxo-4-hydroxy-4-carboxy-5-ureidoimidazoline decarboxylase